MNPIAKMLVEMARFYGENIDPRQSEMYVEVLSQFPLDQVMHAAKMYVQNPKNNRFPIPPHKIMADLIPSVEPKDIARISAGKIVEAISRFGYTNPERAKEHIGEEGWTVVKRMGGWNHICQQMGVTIQETTFVAQARDAIESEMNLKKAGYDTSKSVSDQHVIGRAHDVSNLIGDLANQKALDVKK